MYEEMNANVNPVAEAAVVELLANVFNAIAYMDADTIRYNVELACVGGMTKIDRSIPIELADYLLSHFSFIFVGLIVNKDFRSTIVEAVSVEIALDDREPEFVTKIREDMNYEPPKDTKNSFIVDLSTYDDEIYKEINLKLSESFDKLSNYNSCIDEFAAELTDDEMMDIGYCSSNFMYLIRAFAKNTVFSNYVMAVVRSVEKNLGDMDNNI